MLTISNLSGNIDDTAILNGVDLTVNPGEIHAIMGPNGSGKSTLSKLITGHPDYEVTGGQIQFKGKDLLEMDPDERALNGVFMSFQYPVDIPGVNNESFLRMAYNAKQKHLGNKEVDPLDFAQILDEKRAIIGMDESYLERSVNHGFSGGEKKRNEILQLLVLDPDLIILDETDSGLDIDAIQDVAKAVNTFKSKDKSILIITHYQRILSYIEPDFVHILHNGKIEESGDKSLALKLEEQGYQWVKDAPNLNGDS
ncbi:MAG: Fe-S cluster assembly ATPase SufC [Actinobacteria bacterium]|nr:Fe-S cluster assembly ATPase SufC [Actinomycetota bacterium]